VQEAYPDTELNFQTRVRKKKQGKGMMAKLCLHLGKGSMKSRVGLTEQSPGGTSHEIKVQGRPSVLGGKRTADFPCCGWGGS